MKTLKKIAIAVSTAAVLAVSSVPAFAADETKLRIMTHFPQDSVSGKSLANYIKNIQEMSNGEIKVEAFYASSVVKSVEAFDAAVNGILDCDATGGAYQTGKNSAFQFVGDLMGGYTNPYQQLSWMIHNDGRAKVNKLYNKYKMQFVGWAIPGPESLTSTKPIRNTADFKDWKFRSPPGLATKVFSAMGASPIVMDFNEIFTALETGIIDGADAANITTNVGLGLLDIGKHTNYPGFHSMPADHMACNKKVWDKMPKHHQRIMEVAMDAEALRLATQMEVLNGQTAKEQRAKGVNLYTWSDEELNKYRAAVKKGWGEFADTPESKELLADHVDFLTKLGLMK